MDAARATVALLQKQVERERFTFPFESMPRRAQLISQGLPLTHFLRIVRGITLKGAGFADVGQELVWLFAICAALVLLTSLPFNMKLV